MYPYSPVNLGDTFDHRILESKKKPTVKVFLISPVFMAPQYHTDYYRKTKEFREKLRVHRLFFFARV